MKVNYSLAILSVFGGAVLLSLSGCEPGSPSSEGELDEEQLLLQAGQQRSRACMGCHGPKGLSRVQSYPSLAGRPQAYLEGRLRAYRSGERSDPMMSSVARNLSDEDITALSYYYASLPGADSND